MVQFSDFAFLNDTFSRDVMDIRRNLKLRHVTATCEGILVSVQYRVSVPISSDICTLVTRLLSLSFSHLIFIAI